MKFDKRFDGFNIVATFNQTNVELKWDILHADLLVLITFNQTNVELKLAKRYGGLKSIKLLIRLM